MKIEPYTHCNQAKDFMVDKVDEVRERDRGGREEKRLKRFALVNEDNKTQSIYFGEAFLNCTFLIVAQLRPHAALIQRLYKGGGGQALGYRRRRRGSVGGPSIHHIRNALLIQHESGTLNS